MKCKPQLIVASGLGLLLAGLCLPAQALAQGQGPAPVAQAAAYAQAPGAPAPVYERYAPNLGIWYRLVPYGNGGGYYGQGAGPVAAAAAAPNGDGAYNPNFPPGGYPGPYAPSAPMTYGARLTRYPVAGSPCAYLQLEPGDMIVSLDNMPFYGPNDIRAHYGQTTVMFVNIRTGFPQPGNLLLP